MTNYLQGFFIALLLLLSFDRAKPCIAESEQLEQKSTTTSIKIIFHANPSSLLERHIKLSFRGGFLKYANANGSKAKVISSGRAVLSYKEEIFFNPHDIGNLSQIIKFFEMPPDKIKRVPLRVIKTSENQHEIVFQLEEDSSLLKNETIKKIIGQVSSRKKYLIKYQSPDGSCMYSIEPSPELKDKLLPEKEALEVLYGVIIKVESNKKTATIVNIGKPLDEISREVNLFFNLKNKYISEPFLHIAAGSILPRKIDYLFYNTLINTIMKYTVSIHSSLNYDVICPSTKSLLLGEKLREFEKSGKFPFSSLNLYTRKRKRVTKGFRIFKVKGKKILVTGLNSVHDTDTLDPEIRALFYIEDPLKSFARLKAEKLKKLKPDLVIVLTTMDEKEIAQLKQIGGVDIIIGNSPSHNINSYTNLIKFTPPFFKSDILNHKPLLVTTAGVSSRGVIEINWTGEKISEIKLQKFNVLWNDKPHEEIKRVVNRILLEGSKDFSSIYLPDISKSGKEIKRIKKMIWGKDILVKGVKLSRPAQTPAIYTDNLWMNFVTNVIYKKFDTNCFISRNLPREFIPIGPIGKFYIFDWLNVNDAVNTTKVSGKQLKEILLYIRALNEHGATPQPTTIFVSGADPEKLLIEGRPINEKIRYTVGFSDYLLLDTKFKEKLKGCKIYSRFRMNRGKYEPDENGQRVLIRDTVLEEIESYKKPEGDQFDTHKTEKFYSNFGDFSEKVHPAIFVDVRKLGLSFASCSSFNNSNYTGVSETRVSSPDSISIGGELEVNIEYDSKIIGIENNVKLSYMKKQIQTQNQTTEQENYDDAVFSSELITKLISIGTRKQYRIFLTGFGKITFDTEFTPVKDAETGERNPRQKILYASTGLKLRSRGGLKQLYISALFKNDFSQTKGSFEAGIGGGFEFQVDLKRFSYLSSMSLKYFPYTKHDTPSDLGFIVEFTNNFYLNIYKDIYFSLNFDYFLFRGKVRPALGPGLNLIVSSTLTYRSIFGFFI